MLAGLDPEDAAGLLADAEAEDAAAILTELDTDVAAEIVAVLDADVAADIVAELDTQDAADILVELDAADAAEIVAELATEDAAEIIEVASAQDAADILEHEERFRALPVPIVIDHMARVPTADGLEQEPFKMLLRFMENANTWVKITGAERISAAGPPFHDAVPFAQALIAAAPDRVLWGTDFPHPNITRHMPNDGDLVDLLALYAPDPELRRRIVVDNPARLYGFE